MKKSRPATLLSVLCQPSAVEKIQEIIFAETSTFGIRYQEMDRKFLDRELVEVETPAGEQHLLPPAQARTQERQHGRHVPNPVFRFVGIG